MDDKMTKPVEKTHLVLSPTGESIRVSMFEFSAHDEQTSPSMHEKKSPLADKTPDRDVKDLVQHAMALLNSSNTSTTKPSKTLSDTRDSDCRLLPMYIYDTDNVTIQDLDELRSLVDDHYRLPNMLIADRGTCKTNEDSVRAWLTKLRVRLSDDDIKRLMQPQPNVTAYLDADADEFSLYQYHMV
jgi:hypothetical protein